MWNGIGLTLTALAMWLVSPAPTGHAQQEKRVALTLDADKSSRHRFRLVLDLGDGRTVATPTADLLMFKPRVNF